MAKKPAKDKENKDKKGKKAASAKSAPAPKKETASPKVKKPKKIILKKSVKEEKKAPSKVIPPSHAKTEASTPKITPPKKPVEKPDIFPEIKEHTEKATPQVLQPEASKEEFAESDAPPRKKISVDIPIAVKDFAVKLDVRPNELMKTMIEKGIFVTINQGLGADVVKNIAAFYGVEITEAPTLEQKVLKEEEKEDKKNLVLRPPVVTFMGHVDHGKTSLLDTIRKTKVASREYGGITQHIGAYQVMFKKGAVTFLDTPGHEAFTEMRARGANATDVVVLVVAADDGVKPQTIEAADHAKAAGVPIVVALNKCDLPHVNIEKVKTQLAQINLAPEDWGGKTISVQVSAKTGKGIDELLEMLLLEAELLELKANPNTLAKGVVVESELSRGKGVVATVLVKGGTLRTGDVVVAGSHCGRVKAMMNDRGERVTEAPPSMPVEIMGLSGVPRAGERFFVVLDERKARDYCLQKEAADTEKKLSSSQRISLEGLYQDITAGKIKELNIVLKGDVSGSIEALEKSLLELSTKDININIIHTAVGDVNDSDVVLALASKAIVIGFHVRVEPKAQITAEREGVEVKLYNIIYETIADIKAAMEGMLEPIYKEVFLGRAQIRQVFVGSKVGTIAGSYVVKGKIVRSAIAKLVRNGKIVYEGKINSLKRFKDDAREVAEGFECGIALFNHNDIKEGDTIEAYEMQKFARRLGGK
ncbi:MAG: translation initiation factor IF-2 [Candidatus Omnitrophota bacterium]